jgi:hypothetical protein
LKLAEGAKIMIKRNLWTSKGLVNGAQGVIQKIWYVVMGVIGIHVGSKPCHPGVVGPIPQSVSTSLISGLECFLPE